MKPRAFDPARREAFLGRVAEGASVVQACKLVGVGRSTAHDWLALGRGARPGGRPEHRAFAEAFDAALAEAELALTKLLAEHAKAEKGGAGSVKATIALLELRAAMVERKAKVALLEAQRELVRANVRIANARAVVAEAEAGEGGGRAVIIGVDAILGDPSVSMEARKEVAAWVARGKMTTLERWNLGDEPEPKGEPWPM